MGAAREQVLTSHDPLPANELARAMDCHEYLTAISDGRLPPAPITRLAGIEALSIAHGEVTYRCNPDESFLNPIGFIHGGLACTLLDYAAAGALLTTLPAGASHSPRQTSETRTTSSSRLRRAACSCSNEPGQALTWHD
jgi:acyl-coenzyme A thioesterase PaaI-like protein